jgi:hypothetical protein
MSSVELKPGTQVAHFETGEEGFLLGPFWRKGEKWWTAFWKEAGTMALRESDIKN